MKLVEVHSTKSTMNINYIELIEELHYKWTAECEKVMNNED